MWKESMDLGLFLERFERTMRECEVAEEEWVDRLCAKLQEKLCVRISDLRDEDAGSIEGCWRNNHYVRSPDL